MSQAKIDTIYVRFKGDTVDYDRAVDRVDKGLDKMGRSMQRFGKQMTMYVSAPIAAAGALAIREFAKIDQAMQKSVAIMGSSVADFGGDMMAMKETMQDLAVTTSLTTATSAEKLSESYYFLASAGFDAKQSMEALDDVNRFAIAGMFDMARATDLLTDAQSALGLNSGTVEERMAGMARVSDVLVRANTLANASVEQFSVALTSKAGTSMKVFNKTIEEGVAVLSVYADQGIKAELAGTSYDRVLRLLSKSAMDNASAHKAFGLEVFNSEGAMNSMVDIAKQLEDGFAGMSKEEQVAALAMLGFEARVQQAIFPLIGASDQIAKYQSELENATGYTRDVAEKQMQSFSNQMKITANFVKAVARQVGEILAPRVIALGKVIRKASMWFLELNDVSQKVLVTIGSMVAALGPMITLVGIGVPIVNSLSASFTTLGIAIRTSTKAVWAFARGLVIALAPVLAPIAIVALKIALIGTAIAGLWAYMNGAGSITEAWQMIKAAVVSVAEVTMGFFRNWETNWPLIKDMVSDFVANLGQNMTAIFNNLITNIGVFVRTAAEVLGILFGWIVAQGLPIAQGFAMQFSAAMAQLWGWIVKTARTAIIQMTLAFLNMAKTISEMFQIVFEEIGKMFRQAAIASIKMAVALKNLDLKAAIQIGTEFVGDVAKGAAKAATKVALTGIAAVKKATKPIIDAFDAGVVEGMTTDSLLGSMGAAINNAAFVDPLAGTTVAGMPDFATDMGGGMTGDEFWGDQSLDPALGLGTGWEPLPLEVDTDALDEEKEKTESTPWVVSLGVNAQSARSAQAALIQYNQKMGLMKIESDAAEAKKTKQEQDKADLKRQREKERAEDKASKEAATRELFSYLQSIAEFLGVDSDTITPANISGSGA